MLLKHPDDHRADGGGVPEERAGLEQYVLVRERPRARLHLTVGLL